MAIIDARMLANLVNDLDRHIRTGNKELGLNTLGLLREGLGNRLAQESMEANLKAYEEAQARLNMPKPQPAMIGGFESSQESIDNSIDNSIDKPKRTRRKKSEMQNEQE